MDRDIYLILIGAGISLASSIVTLILQFFLGLWGERIRSKREAKEHQVKEIRAVLLDKSEPVRIRPGSLLKRMAPDDSGSVDLDLPSFLRRKKADGSSEPVLPVTPSQFWLSVFVGVLVFMIWIGMTFIH